MDQEIYLRMAGSITEGRGLSFEPGIAALKVIDAGGDTPLAAWVSDPGYVFGITPVGVPTATIEPGYPLLLAGAFALAGPTSGAVFMVNMAAQIVGAWAIFLLAARLSGRRAGLVAASCFALYPYLVFYSSAAMTEAVHAAMVPVIVLATLRSERGAMPSLLAGCSTGLLFLVRSTGIFILPVQLLYAALGRRWRSALLMLAGFAVCAAPWVARNQLEMGRPVLLPTKGSLNLWMRNNPDALALEGIRVPGGILEGLSRTDLLAYPAFSPDQGELERSDELRDRALGFIAANPRLFAWLSLCRLGEFLSPLPAGGGTAAILAGFLFYLPVALLAAAGLARNARHPGVLLAAGVFAAYAAVHALAHGGIRYRLPVDTMLMVLAALAVFPIRRRAE